MPVLHELVTMEKCPLKHQGYYSLWQLSLNYSQIVDRESGPLPGIFGMKMGRSMFIVIHSDYDSKESAYFRHFLNLSFDLIINYIFKITRHSL